MYVLLLILCGDVETNPGPQPDVNRRISIMQLNIRSIRNKIDSISEHFSDFDIICFTETHLDANIQNQNLEIESHDSTMYRSDLSAHSGGLLVYVSNKLAEI